MAEIEILVDDDGNSQVTAKRNEGEDPACFVLQKTLDILKGSGLAVQNVKQLEKNLHGHTHTFK